MDDRIFPYERAAYLTKQYNWAKFPFVSNGNRCLLIVVRQDQPALHSNRRYHDQLVSRDYAFDAWLACAWFSETGRVARRWHGPRANLIYPEKHSWSIEKWGG